MNVWAVWLFWILLGLAVGQALLVWRFVLALRQARWDVPPETPCPKTAVVLCLRGPDPFLPACLEAILQQDYPEYDVRVVVDSPQDPAWKTVAEAVARHGAANVQVRPLTARRETCSLKCSAVLQAVSELDASYEAVALVDADTVPHRTWLRELVAPLADPRVGACTGNRWYMPAVLSWGSLVRWLWNVAASVQMFWYRIPWGGTLAVKLSVFREAGLADRWSRAFCEDTMLYGQLRRAGYRVAFAPTLMMVNRENVSLRGCYRWVARQLLTARLYHPAWWLVVGHGIGIAAAQLACLGLLGAACVLGDRLAAAWLIAALSLYWLAMAGLTATLERSVRRITAARGEPTDWLRRSALFRVAAALLLTQGLYTGALLAALAARVVQWRGVRYRIDAPWRIRLIEYQPYLEEREPVQTAESL